MKRAILIAAAVLAVVLPVSGAEPRPEGAGHQECRTQTREFPSTEWAQVSAGEAIYRSETVTECLWAVPKGALRTSKAGTIIPKGTYLWSAGDGQYCVRDGATGYCFIDRDGDGDFDKSKPMARVRGVNLNTPYTREWAQVPNAMGQHREELVLAHEGGSLRGFLREYGQVSEIALPPLLSEGGVVRVMGRSIEVQPEEGGGFRVRRVDP